MERNQIVGFLLMGILLLLYFTIVAPTPIQETEKIENNSSVEKKIEPQTLPQKEEEKQNIFSSIDSLEAIPVIIENKDIKVTLNTQCGCIEEVELKNYKKYDKTKLLLFLKENNEMKEYLLFEGKKVNLNKFTFSIETGESKKVVFSTQSGERSIYRRYELKNSGFEIDYSVETQGWEEEENRLYFEWKNALPRLELAKEQSTYRTTINYYADGSFDYLSESSEDEKMNIPNIEWMSMKQKFFNSSVIAKENKWNATILKISNNDDENIIKDAMVILEIPFDAKAQWSYYFGPNEYNICKQVAVDFEKNVYLGWTIFTTVNKYIIMPLFEGLQKITNNYGLIIFILVLIVKMFLFPLTYKSYTSMAKMRVLKPELDKIKAENQGSPQKVQQEQMKVYTAFGVNPLSGCIPMLVQMPIVLAMFNFFPNIIELRQKSFLWADDLSTYDSIIDLSFNIPFYGNHVSLFTLLMTVSTIVYTYYNNQITPTTAGSPAMMKTIGYIMPVFILFFLNSFAAGLTYYYFVSNIITIGQQFAIRRIVDEKKIREKLDLRKQRKKGTKKQSFREKMESKLQKQEEITKQRKKNRNG